MMPVMGIDLMEDLRQRFKASGLTVTQWAERSSVPQPVVFRLFHGERDNPTVKTYQKLLSALGYRVKIERKTR
ncbi:MAG: hypothetical protein DCC66_13395 [Planctomycetota bacterium]|nr:MAG: hypothetical protein DCC66_13395 [Planctomycetota bacterium]